MKSFGTVPTILLGLTVAVGSASMSFADETVTTTSKTTTYSGVVSSIDPSASTIILKSESSPSPVTYRYSKETTFVDSNGNTVSYEAIRNSPVRVEYSTDGGQTIVRRVIQTGPAVVVTPPAAGAPVMRREHTETRTETNE